MAVQSLRLIKTLPQLLTKECAKTPRIYNDIPTILMNDIGQDLHKTVLFQTNCDHFKMLKIQENSPIFWHIFV